MKTVLLVSLVLAFGATLALGQNGSIGIFNDPAGTSCNLTGAVEPDYPAGWVFFYFLHVSAVGATASEWAAPHPACLNAIHVADIRVYPVTFGFTETGIVVGYPSCKTGTFLIESVLYNVIAPAPECCFWPVVAAPRTPSGKIEIPDCQYRMTYGTGGQGILHATAACNCDVIVPTEETTWGGVKALYAE